MISRNLFFGFDFYPDTVSQYPFTRYSIPSFLTGERYLNQSIYDEYINKSFNLNSSLLKNAVDQGCDVQLFRWGMSTPIPHNPNLYSNISKRSFIAIPNSVDFKRLLYYELMIISPHFLKKFFYYKLFSDASSDTQDWNIFLSKNRNFEPELTGQCVLKIVHLKGLHTPILGANGDSSFDNSVYQSRALEELNAISNYLEIYKKNNVFDNTAVIIAGDHGAGMQRFDLSFPSDKKYEFTAKSSLQQTAMPALMVKPFNSTKIPLQISDSKLELQNINCIVNRFIDQSYKSHYCDFDYSKERSFYFADNANLTSTGYANNFTEFLIKGNVYLDSSWIYHNKVYSEIPLSNSGQPVIKFNNIYPLGILAKKRVLVFGWGEPRDGFTWTSGKRSRLAIPVSSSSDLVLEATISPLVIPGKIDKQDVDIFIGPTRVGSWSISAPGVYKVVIPQALLKGGVLDISFDLLNATSAKKLGIGPDPEILALQFSTIKVSEVGYQLGKLVSFGKTGAMLNFEVFGWGEPRDGFTWTSGKRSRLAIPVSSSSDLVLEATISPLVIPGKIDKQDVDIFIGPTRVGSWSISAPGVYKVVIPQALLKGGVLDISFDLLNATSAKKLGIGPDPEILALQFSTIKVSEVGYQLGK